MVGDSHATAGNLPTVLLEKALTVLARVGDDRSAAPDLLAADALITYAIEAAAESGSVEEVARKAMHEISSVE